MIDVPFDLWFPWIFNPVLSMIQIEVNNWKLLVILGVVVEEWGKFSCLRAKG